MLLMQLQASLGMCLQDSKLKQVLAIPVPSDGKDPEKAK